MKKPINEEVAKVERARSLRVAPPVDQQRDVPTELATLMDLSDRRAGRGDSLRAGLGQEATSEVGQVAGFRRDA